MTAAKTGPPEVSRAWGVSAPSRPASTAPRTIAPGTCACIRVSARVRAASSSVRFTPGLGRKKSTALFAMGWEYKRLAGLGTSPDKGENVLAVDPRKELDADASPAGRRCPGGGI